MNNKSSLILLRGLPGSGKTALAKVLSENGKYPVHSIDSYFTDENGNYHFEFDKNHLAYKNCEEQTRNSLRNKCEKIFVDNTFTLGWEMEPYFKMAAEFDYTLFVITVENYHGNKNTHGISEEQIEKMAAKYKVKLT
ncbi:MAG: AAA family ATPase [Bacteroidia bacterium]